jgi:type I restriction enzyme M protein
MNNFSEITNFIWTIAELLRDDFKRSKYQDIVLPLTVLRRIDCVLDPTKQEVLKAHARLKGKLDNLDPQLRRASGYAFYNTSPFSFARLLDDAPHQTCVKYWRSLISKIRLPSWKKPVCFFW